MTDDLVTRLRDGFPTSQGFSGYYPDITKAVAMMQEAAARIEADAATIARLVEALESIERETQNVTPELMNQQMALHSAASVARAAIAAAKGDTEIPASAENGRATVSRMQKGDVS